MRLGLCAAVVAVAACSQTSTEPTSSTVPVSQSSVDEHVEALRARLHKAGLDPMRLRHSAEKDGHIIGMLNWRSAGSAGSRR